MRRVWTGARSCDLRLPEQFVERDRQVPYTDARRMIDGVGNCRRRSDDTDLADALCPDRTRVRIELIDNVDVDRGNVRIDGYVILREVLVNDPADVRVDDAL